jgi:hypothetical protein
VRQMRRHLVDRRGSAPHRPLTPATLQRPRRSRRLARLEPLVAASFRPPDPWRCNASHEPSSPTERVALPFGERPEGLETPAAEPLKARPTPSRPSRN